MNLSNKFIVSVIFFYYNCFMDKKCIIEETLWANTDNAWKPSYTYEFNSWAEARKFILEKKSSRYSYMHKYNIQYLVNNV